MGKAIQHAPSLGKRVNGAAVVFLIQEKARFLTVDVIYFVANAVFGNFNGSVGMIQKGK